MFGVIMAGGGGTRLWPKSRENFPKQIHALCSEKPLIEEMTDLLSGIVGQEQVFIVTNAHHAQAIKKIIPAAAEKILIDPYRRDTAACIGLAAVYLSKVDPNAVMAVFPADHFIASKERFGKVVQTAGELAAEGHVVTIGIKPTGPETGYGYIEMADCTGDVNDQKVYKVCRFVEKPNLDTAKQYCTAGNYLWNSGMFAWSIPTVLNLFEKHLPDTYARLMKIRDAIGTPNEEEVLHREYNEMQRISVDYGIMEKLDDILVLPGDFGWNDIGSWTTVAEIAAKDEDGNVVNASHIGLDTHNCLIHGCDNRIIATIGMEDLIIVDTEDALLICPKNRSQDVKKIVDKLKEMNMEDYL